MAQFGLGLSVGLIIAAACFVGGVYYGTKRSWADIGIRIQRIHRYREGLDRAERERWG